MILRRTERHQLQVIQLRRKLRLKQEQYISLRSGCQDLIRLQAGLLHCPWAVIASEAKQSPSIELRLPSCRPAQHRQSLRSFAMTTLQQPCASSPAAGGYYCGAQRRDRFYVDNRAGDDAISAVSNMSALGRTENLSGLQSIQRLPISARQAGTLDRSPRPSSFSSTERWKTARPDRRAVLSPRRRRAPRRLDASPPHVPPCWAAATACS
jgi:hypothetical protein